MLLCTHLNIINTGWESSMINLASPQILLWKDMSCFSWFWQCGDRRTTWVKPVITSCCDCGLASWINKTEVINDPLGQPADSAMKRFALYRLILKCGDGGTDDTRENSDGMATCYGQALWIKYYLWLKPKPAALLVQIAELRSRRNRKWKQQASESLS